jgi:hypothetical protein
VPPLKYSAFLNISTEVGTVIPIFDQKVEWKNIGRGYTTEYMDQTALLVTLFFTLIIGAGVGFYVAKLLF